MMSRIRFFLYNLLFFPLLLLLLPGYLLRIRKRGGYGRKAAQRFGILDAKTLDRIGTGRIWIHAVSVGEVGIALKFANEFHRRNPTAHFLLSTTTSTGLAIVEQQASPWLEPMANPIDFPFITSRLVGKLRPAALLMVEADLWPNRVEACRAMGVPVALLNARLSSRSERRFHMFRKITSPFFNHLGLITLTEPEDFDRWLSLGVTPSILQQTGNMKYDCATGIVSPSAVTRDSPVIRALGWQQEDPLFLAASTHGAEEVEVARAFQLLKKDVPNLRLVIAPRHVERRKEITESLEALGLCIALRSGELFPGADLLLLDTTGELSSWYPASTVVFVGKSLPCSVNKGGQNMIEPLLAGAPVFFGTNTGNFEPLASRLCESNSAIRVDGANSIASAVAFFLTHPERRVEVIRCAERLLTPHREATVRNCLLVERLLGGAFPEETGGM